MRRTQTAIRKCAEWLAYCLSIGWTKSDLSGLEKIWYEHHDPRGNLKVGIKKFTTPTPNQGH